MCPPSLQFKGRSTPNELQLIHFMCPLLLPYKMQRLKARRLTMSSCGYIFSPTSLQARESRFPDLRSPYGQLAFLRQTLQVFLRQAPTLFGSLLHSSVQQLIAFGYASKLTQPTLFVTKLLHSTTIGAAPLRDKIIFRWSIILSLPCVGSADKSS